MRKKGVISPLPPITPSTLKEEPLVLPPAEINIPTKVYNAIWPPKKEGKDGAV